MERSSYPFIHLSSAVGAVLRNIRPLGGGREIHSEAVCAFRAAEPALVRAVNARQGVEHDAAAGAVILLVHRSEPHALSAMRLPVLADDPPDERCDEHEQDCGQPEDIHRSLLHAASRVM